jgi:hypothetical protein
VHGLGPIAGKKRGRRERERRTGEGGKEGERMGGKKKEKKGVG